MPIVLSRYEAEEFLYDDNSSLLAKSFTSSIESELDFFPVSKFVNNPLNNSKECIEPI
jgi:putative SOS response-associated peptidase YedK